MVISPCLLSTLTSSGRKGCKRLEHNRPVATHAILNASATEAPITTAQGQGIYFCIKQMGVIGVDEVYLSRVPISVKRIA